MKHLIIIGAGGMGRCLYNLARESKGYLEEFDVKGFIDDNLKALDGFEGYEPVLSTIADYQPEEDDVFADEVIAFGPGIHLGTFETESGITRQLLLHIIIGFINHFLHTDDVRLARLDDFEADVLAVIPAATFHFVGGKASDADVATHYGMSCLS